MQKLTTTENKTPYAGQIFYSSWGYDQTNIDFYQVIKVVKSRVYFKKIGSKVDKTKNGSGNMDGFVLPDETKEEKTEKNYAIWKNITWRSGGDVFFKIDDYRSAYEWEGDSLRYSSWN